MVTGLKRRLLPTSSLSTTTVKLIITHCISLKALEDSMWEEDVHARYHGYKMYQDTLYNDPARNDVLSTCMR